MLPGAGGCGSSGRCQRNARAASRASCRLMKRANAKAGRALANGFASGPTLPIIRRRVAGATAPAGLALDKRHPEAGLPGRRTCSPQPIGPVIGPSRPSRMPAQMRYRVRCCQPWRPMPSFAPMAMRLARRSGRRLASRISRWMVASARGSCRRRISSTPTNALISRYRSFIGPFRGPASKSLID